MNENLEKEIEKLKRTIRDYLRLARKFGFEDEFTEKGVDEMLDDLSELMKKRN